MKYQRALLPFIFSFFCLNSVNAQEKKKLYFYADTITISKGNRVLEIQKQIEVFYIFYCKCLISKKDIVFSYIANKENKPTNIKPKAEYISWKELLKRYDNNPAGFDKNYDLYITERLPNNKYLQNKVTVNYPSKATVDYEVIHE